LLFALALAAGEAGPAAAATQNATVTANVVRPLTLTSVQNLDLGTITLGLGTWSDAVVGISQAGAFSCSTDVVCTGAPQVAKYKVTGSNKMVVLISAPNVTLVDAADPTQKLTLVVDSPKQVTLTSSGEPGVTFPIGGSITISSTTATGDYTGTFDVTVDYQ
jgi:hypothetical protein